MATEKMQPHINQPVSRLTGAFPARSVTSFAICIAFWCVYLAIYLPFLPTASGTVGHDYSLHFPNLLTGYYWYLQNGFRVTPWFSPSQCGGFPFISDPNVIYYSATQLFVIAGLSPMKAIQLTFAAFALCGMAGAYLLMRHSFQSSRVAATVAAVLFLFNGFFTYRMLIGHLTFHAFALLPLMITAVLVPPADRRRSVFELGVRVCIAGLCLTYMFQTGMVHGIPPAIIAALVIFLIHTLRFGWQSTPWILFIFAFILAMALCAGRFTGEFALLSTFPRDNYALPGFASISSGLWSVFHILFLDLSVEHPEVVNSQWILDRHEWEFGVSTAPIMVVSVWAMTLLFRSREKSGKETRAPGTASRWFAVNRLSVYAAIIILLALPLALNTYNVAWNAFLKELPYIRNSSNLVRFFCAYIPVVIVVAAIALDRIALPRPAFRLAVAALALFVVLWQNTTVNREYYATQKYSINPVETEYERVRVENTVPPIREIGNPLERIGGPNDGLITGQSQLYCYQPLMGYRLEYFPVASLRPGPITAPVGNVINLKNPACYLFPEENSCRSGDHFERAALDEALAFAAYRPFAFSRSSLQEAMSRISLGSLIGVIAFLFTALMRVIFNWRMH